MRLHERLLDQLHEIFQVFDAQMSLISEIDRAILSLDKSLDKVLLAISPGLIKASGAQAASFVIPADNELLPVSDGESPRWLAEFLQQRSEELLSLQHDAHLVIKGNLPQPLRAIFCLPVVVERRIFAILLMTFESEQQRLLIPETVSFAQMAVVQVGIMIKRFLEQRTSQLKSDLVQVFFDEKLKPSACWHEIVEHVSSFLPDWPPLLIEPSPKVQLLSYREGDRHLRIVGTQGDEMVGTEVLVDSSICGMLIQDRSLTYLSINPRKYPERYKGFLLTEENTVPQSELAVRIAYGDKIIGILNLEHPDPNMFRSQHVETILSASAFLAPFLAALQERYEVVY